MAKVVKFELFDGTYRMVNPRMDIPDDLSGEYVSLADYERLEALLKRWNEIAPGANWIIDYHNSDRALFDKIEQLIQDTKETIA